MRGKKFLITAALAAVFAVAAVFGGCQHASRGNPEHVHDFGDWAIAVDATCTEPGTMKRECRVPGCEEYETSTIAPKNHEYGDWVVSQEVTCTTDGEKYQECTRPGCGHRNTQTIEHHGHEYGEEKYGYNFDTHWRKCTKCGQKETAAPHEYNPGETVCKKCGWDTSLDVLAFALNGDGQSYKVTGFKDKNQPSAKIIIPDEFNDMPVTEVDEFAFTTGYLDHFSPLSEVVFGNNIRKIGVSAFWHCTNITELVLPESLETIGKYAFSSCSGIQNITFGNGLKLIDCQGFYGCTSYEELNLPDSLETLGESAFYNNTGLKRVNCGDNLKTADMFAFYGCSELTDIDFGNSPVSLYYQTFGECTNLKNVILSDNIVSIGDKQVFQNCNSIDYNEKDGVKYLGNEHNLYVAAMKCVDDAKTAFVSEEGTAVIAAAAFEEIGTLQSVVLSDSVRTIDPSAFSGCSGLNHLTLGSGIKNINRSAFYDCEAIERVDVGSIETWLGITFAFNENDIGQEKYRGYVNPLYYGAELYVDGTKLTTLQVPLGITKISSFAFVGYDFITSVFIGRDVEQIGLFAFKECPNITELTVSPDNGYFRSDNNCVIEKSAEKIVLGCSWSDINDVTGVKEIGEYVFEDINFQNKDVTIPDSVQTIGEYAFSSAKIRILRVGNGLKKCCENAFWGVGVREGQSSVTKIHEIYISDINSWCAIDFENEYAMPIDWESNAYIAGQIITNYQSTGLEIPRTVKEVKPYAFFNTAINILKISSETTKIDATSFAKTCNLGDISVEEENPVYKLSATGDGIIDVTTKTLFLCKNKTNVDFTSDDIEKVGAYAFAYRGMKSILLPDKITEIGEYAFQSCDMEHITIPTSVTKICDYAFEDCRDLVSITIPENVTYIGYNAFNCGASYCNLQSAEFADPNGWERKYLEHEYAAVDVNNPSQNAKNLIEHGYVWKKQ